MHVRTLTLTLPHGPTTRGRRGLPPPLPLEAGQMGELRSRSRGCRTVRLPRAGAEQRRQSPRTPALRRETLPPTFLGARRSGGHVSLSLNREDESPMVGHPWWVGTASKMDSDHFRKCHRAAMHVVVKIARVTGPRGTAASPALRPTSLSELKF